MGVEHHLFDGVPAVELLGNNTRLLAGEHGDRARKYVVLQADVGELLEPVELVLVLRIRVSVGQRARHAVEHPRTRPLDLHFSQLSKLARDLDQLGIVEHLEVAFSQRLEDPIAVPANVHPIDLHPNWALDPAEHVE